MKKALYFFIYIIFTFSLGAESIELYTFTDVMALKSLLPSQIYGSIGVGASLDEDLAVEIPVSFRFDKTGGEEFLIDTSIQLLIYPWGRGPYISLSLIRLIAFMGNYLPEENLHYLNDIGLGYRWNFFSLFSISPQIILTDPSAMYEESYEYIHGFVPSFNKIEISINFHITLNNISID